MAEITTWTEAAKQLGYTTQALRAWRKMPAAPQVADVEAWSSFIQENGLGESGNRVSEDREHWLTLQAEYRANLLKIESEHAEGKIVYKDELDARDARIAQAQRGMLYETLTVELPVRCEGKTAVEIRVLLREAADRVCVIMQERLNEWAVPNHEE